MRAILLCLFFIQGIQLFAQQPCATSQYAALQQEMNPSLASKDRVVENFIRQQVLSQTATEAAE
ncbi:MAG: hypothetical protein WKF70_12650, partial [Chitinophagaceae bacterium]